MAWTDEDRRRLWAEQRRVHQAEMARAAAETARRNAERQAAQLERQKWVKESMERWDKMNHDMNLPKSVAAKPHVPEPVVNSGGSHKSGSFGKAALFVLVMVLGLAFLGNKHDSSSNQGGAESPSSSSTDTPAVPPTETATQPSAPLVEERTAEAPATPAGPDNTSPLPVDTAPSTAAPAQADNPITAPSVYPLSPPASSVLVERRFIASHKGSDGCDGELIFAPTGFRFNCPSDPRRGFTVYRIEVETLHKDGVQLFSGKKYHFKVEGMEKNAVDDLFAWWMGGAVMAQVAH